MRGLDVAPVRARTDSDHRCRSGRRFLEDLLRRTPADRRVDPVVLQGHGARHHEDVLPCIRLHRGLHRSLSGMSRGSHQRVIVVQRDRVQDQVADRRLRSANHTFDAPGALLELDPDDAGLAHLGQGLPPCGGFTTDARPSMAVSFPHRSRNSRRLTPRASRCSPRVWSVVHGWDVGASMHHLRWTVHFARRACNDTPRRQRPGFRMYENPGLFRPRRAVRDTDLSEVIPEAPQPRRDPCCAR